ncbi:MAG: 30S ribosomal protein S1, partial [Brachybacterium sp.]
PETNEWLEGYDAQREVWEGQYAAAYERWTAHKAQVVEAIKADEESANAPAAASTSSSSSSTESAAPASQSSYQSSSSDEGTLASDEALAALRAKLTGN